MKVDCRHYESRSLRNGDSVRRCRLDLAPEAPWRCPQDCERYTPRPIDLAWEEGSSAPAPTDDLELDEAAFDILAQAESALSEASQTIRAEEEAKAARRAKRRNWKKRR